LLKITYKPKLKNELALKKYIKNADKKQSSGGGGSDRIECNNIKHNNIFKH
tara:strand:- start:175 stop:327 length:153 start_codon:yes stop_codon:yes gene_type:complete